MHLQMQKMAITLIKRSGSKVTKMETLQLEALKNVIEWYGSSLPASLNTESFVEFCIQSKHFANGIAPDIPIRLDPKAWTGCTDGKTIFLPTAYFTKGYYDNYGIPEIYHSAAALLMVNGVQIHEALHCELSVFGFREFVGHNAVAIDYLEKTQGFAKCLNVVEDVYIEEHCRTFRWNLMIFLDGHHQILFSENEIDKYIADIDGKPLDPDIIMNYLYFSKAIHNLGNPKLQVVDEFIAILNKARNAELTVAERVEIAVELFEAIMEFNSGESETEFEKTPKLSPESFGEDSEEDSGSNLPDDEEYKESMDSLAEKFAQAMQEQEAKEALKEERSKESDKPAKRPIVDCDGTKFKPITIKSVDVMAVGFINPHSTRQIDPSTAWSKLGSHLRLARQTKTHVGTPTSKGGKLVKNQLHRIITDGKVLANQNYNKVKRGKPEVVILVDASGSMEGNYVRDPSGSKGSMSLLQYTIGASYGMFLALMNADIPVGVYAHTSPSGSDERSALIVPTAFFKMPVAGKTKERITNNNFSIRFNLLTGINTCQNYDGFAIEEVAKGFTDMIGTKLLIVLSDGEPHGPGYSGSTGVRHTQNVVNSLRKKGVSIQSVSLVPGVFDTCQSIYGPEHNHKGFATDLEKVLKNIASLVAVL